MKTNEIQIKKKLDNFVDNERNDSNLSKDNITDGETWKDVEVSWDDVIWEDEKDSEWGESENRDEASWEIYKWQNLDPSGEIESELDIWDLTFGELDLNITRDSNDDTPRLSVVDLFNNWKTTEYYRPDISNLPKECTNRIDDENLKSVLLEIVFKRLWNFRWNLTNWFSKFDWWATKIDISNDDFKDIPIFKKSDIIFWEVNIWLCDWEEFRIVDLEVWWEQFTAIEIPTAIKALEWRETYLWYYFEEYRNNTEFQDQFLDKRIFECIEDWWMILSKWYFKSKEWKILNNKPLFDLVYKDTLLMYSYMSWFRIMWFYESLVLSEMVYRWLWEKFVSFEVPNDYDLFEVLNYVLERISKYLYVDFRSFVDYDTVDCFSDNDIIIDWEWNPIKSIWLYLSNDWRLSWFIFWLLYENFLINFGLWPNYSSSILWNDLSVRLAI